MPYTGESIFLSGEQQWCHDELILDSLENAKYSKKTIFYLQKLSLTPVLAEKIIKVIQERSRQKWSKWVVSECEDNKSFQQTLQVVLRHFQNVVISDPYGPFVRTIETLSNSLSKGSILSRLELREMSLSSDHTALIRRGLAGTSSLKTLRFGTIMFEDSVAVAKLAEGIRSNRSLRSLRLVRCQLKDNEVAMVVDGLQYHPSIHDIDLSGNHCRQAGLKSISFLLTSKDCSLRVLKLNDQFYNSHDTQENSVFHLDELLVGLETNKTLRHLELSRNELDNVDSLLSVLWKCPNLQVLELGGNRISHLKSLKKFWLQTRPSRLRRLELSHNLFFQQAQTRQEESAKWLCRLLESHPELECFSKTTSEAIRSCKSNNPLTVNNFGLFWKQTSFEAKIQHYLDLNMTGRVLVANNKVPLSVWACVLERANKLLEGSRQANAIFHLLQGAVTMVR